MHFHLCLVCNLILFATLDEETIKYLLTILMFSDPINCRISEPDKKLWLKYEYYMYNTIQIYKHATYSGSHTITAWPLEPENGIWLDFVALCDTKSDPNLTFLKTPDTFLDLTLH